MNTRNDAVALVSTKSTRTTAGKDVQVALVSAREVEKRTHLTPQLNENMC